MTCTFFSSFIFRLHRRPVVSYNLFLPMVALSLLCFVPLLKQLTLHSHHQSNNAVISMPFGRQSCSTAATPSDILPAVREGVHEAGGEAVWKESIEALTGLLDEEEAELCLAEAFGWKGWAKASAMMKKYQNPKLPTPVQVQEALEWLAEGPLALNKEEILSSIREHPKTYLIFPNESYRKALGAAPRKYREPDVFKGLIREDPTVLQVTYNCDGEGCASECGSCWVSYENRLSIKSSEANW